MHYVIKEGDRTELKEERLGTRLLEIEGSAS